MSSPSENPLKRLIREIHRRSLWQVLGIYLVGGWVAFEVVQTLTEGLGLPEWFPAFAIVLLVLGLPIVLATAFIQEGGPASSAADSLSDFEGILSSDGEPDGEAGATRRLLTWKNAILGGVGALALLGIVGTGWILFRGGNLVTTSGADDAAAPSSTIEQSIAVLPFDDLSPEGDQEYFVQGLSEEIINALAQVPDLKVAARTSTFVLAERGADIATVADTLGVANVLEGSVRKAGERVRITAQLIEAESGFHLWSETFDRELSDVFEIQDEIARAIMEGLAVPLGMGAEKPLVATATEDMDAYDLYLRARAAYANRATLEDVDAVLGLYEEAIAADPDYALAHAGAAEAWSVRPTYGGDWSADLSRAEEEARTALALDPSHARARLALATVHRDRWQWEEAGELYLEALERLPNDPEAHHEYGEYLLNLGRCEQAATEQRRALDLDPLSTVFHHYLVIGLWCAGRVEDALAAGRRAVELGNRPSLNLVPLMLLDAGRAEEAVAFARSHELTWILTLAESVREETVRDADLNAALPISLPAAVGLAVVEDRDAVLQRFEAAAFEVGFGGVSAFVWMPPVQRLLGDDPGFHELLTELGVESGA